MNWHLRKDREKILNDFLIKRLEKNSHSDLLLLPYGTFVDFRLKNLNTMKILKITSFLILSLGLMAANAQTKDNVLKVRGEAVVRAVPELLNFYIPLESKAKTYEETNNLLTSTFNDLQAALIKAGVDEKKIMSDQLSITENYNYQDRERVLIGYVGSITLSIEMPHTEKNLNKVMKVLNNERFNFGYRASFSFSETQKDSLRAAAIKLAVKDAQSKASLLAEALDVRLGEISEINFEFDNGGNDIIVRQTLYADARSTSGGNDIKLNPQIQKINKSVGVIWKITK